MATYEPNYLMWWEKDFAADTYVSRVMRPLHRHFYRALIIASCFNSERPYLPNDDGQLWVFADAESLEQWMAHKDIVLHKFSLTTDGRFWQHKRILADWQKMLAAHEERSEAGKRGGKKAGKGRPAKAQPNLAQAPSGSAQAPSGTMNLTMNLTELNSTEHNTTTLTDQLSENEKAVRPSVRVCVSESESLSTKNKAKRWTEFVMSKEADLPDEMKHAMPRDEERDKILAQLDELGAEDLGMAISEWVDMQSPPLCGLKFNRWQRWLETGTEKFEEWRR